MIRISQLYRVRITIWVLVLGALLSVGCVPKPVPGGSMYGIQAMAIPGTLDESGAMFRYGRFSDDFGTPQNSQTSGFGGLTKLYPLEIEWITKEGVKRYENIDLAKLLDDLGRLTHLPSYRRGTDNIEITLNGPEISIIFHRVEVNFVWINHLYPIYKNDRNIAPLSTID